MTVDLKKKKGKLNSVIQRMYFFVNFNFCFTFQKNSKFCYIKKNNT